VVERSGECLVIIRSHQGPRLAMEYGESGTPPTFVATTARPAAIDSTTQFGKPSSRGGQNRDVKYTGQTRFVRDASRHQHSMSYPQVLCEFRQGFPLLSFANQHKPDVLPGGVRHPSAGNGAKEHLVILHRIQVGDDSHGKDVIRKSHLFSKRYTSRFGQWGERVLVDKVWNDHQAFAIYAFLSNNEFPDRWTVRKHAMRKAIREPIGEPHPRTVHVTPPPMARDYGTGTGKSTAGAAIALA
jgi:hypothetical protein